MFKRSTGWWSTPGLVISALVVGPNLTGGLAGAGGLARARAMIAYPGRGAAEQSAIVLLGVSAIVFFSMFLTGDPAALMLPPDASRAEIAAFRHAMGFDDPAIVQYLRYVGHAAIGDFGTSLRFQQPVLGLIGERLPATALLAVVALGWSTLLGFLLGVIAATSRQGGVCRFCGPAGGAVGTGDPGVLAWAFAYPRGVRGLAAAADRRLRYARPPGAAGDQHRRLLREAR